MVKTDQQATPEAACVKSVCLSKLRLVFIQSYLTIEAVKYLETLQNLIIQTSWFASQLLQSVLKCSWISH